MIKIEICDQNYEAFCSFFQVEDRLDYPFQIKIGLSSDQPDTFPDSFLYHNAVIYYYPSDGDIERYSWVPSEVEDSEKMKSIGYYGFVSSEEKKYDIDASLTEIQLVISHPLHLLGESCRFRIFFDTDLQSILESVIGRYGELFKRYKVNGTSYSNNVADFCIHYCTQYQESDLDFVLRLCQTYGLRILPKGQDIFIDDLGKDPTQDNPAVMIPCGDEMSNDKNARIEWSRKSCSHIRAFMHRNFMAEESPEDLVSKYVGVSGTTTTHPQEEIDPEHPYLLHQKDLYEPESSTAEAKLIVEKIALQHQESVVEVYNSQTTNSLGFQNNNPIAGLRAGDVLFLPEPDGHAILVHKVECRGKNATLSDYEIRFWGREIEFPYVMPAKNKKPVVESFLRATVIEPKKPSNADEYTLGRIKVQFLWQSQEPSSTCWVRLLTPYAGKKHGMYIMPEIGDEVLIGFEGGDIDRPFCLGSVYNNSAQELKSMSGAEQMETFLLKTPENIHFKMHEVPGGEQSTTLGVQDQVVFTMRNDISGSLTSQGTLSLTSEDLFSQKSNKKIDIDVKDGQSKMVLEDTGDILVHAKNQFNQTVECQTSFDFQDTTDLKSKDMTHSVDGSETRTTTGELNISAKPINIDSQSSITINAAEKIVLQVGGNSITIDTSGIKINGMAITGSASQLHTLTGAIVKLNC